MRFRALHVGAALLVLLSPPARLAAQAVCDSDGRRPAPQPGFGLFHCVGGACDIYGGTPAAPEHRFTVEPRLWWIAPSGPAAGRLEEGDQLVAVDGTPITTRKGGRAVARLVEGAPVALTVRRAGTLHTVRITPRRGCQYPMLVVTDTPELPKELMRGNAAAPAPSAPFELGLSLACDECRWVRRYDGTLVWQTMEVPRILAIAPDGPAARSGLAVGDLLLTVDGRAVVSEEGARYLGTVRPGQRIEIGYARGAESHVAHLVPGTPPARR
jgi:S1-C subfamily serine protease